MSWKHAVGLGLILVGAVQAEKQEPAHPSPTAHVSRMRYGVDPEFVHGTWIQRSLDWIVPDGVWSQLRPVGLRPPVRIRPAGKDSPELVLELRSDGPLPVWSDLTLCRVYRELRAVRYRGETVLDVGDVFPFQEQVGGWFGYARFVAEQSASTHLVIEARNDPGKAWRAVMRVQL